MIRSSQLIRFGDGGDNRNIIQLGKSCAPANAGSVCGCGYDAYWVAHRMGCLPGAHRRARFSRLHHDHFRRKSGKQMCRPMLSTNCHPGSRWDFADFNQIGRASCRERVSSKV